MDDKITLINGTDLTKKQRNMLKFNGMSDPEWVARSAFFFQYGKPCQKEGNYYPIWNPSKEMLEKWS